MPHVPLIKVSSFCLPALTRCQEGILYLHSCIVTPGGDDGALLRHGPDSVDPAALRDLAQVHDGRTLLLILAVIIADVIVAVVLSSLRTRETAASLQRILS